MRKSKRAGRSENNCSAKVMRIFAYSKIASKIATPYRAVTESSRALTTRFAKLSSKQKRRAAKARELRRKRSKSSIPSGTNLSIKENCNGQILSQRISALRRSTILVMAFRCTFCYTSGQECAFRPDPVGQRKNLRTPDRVHVCANNRYRDCK